MKKDMELKQFIKEALVSIVDGVEEANEKNDRFKIIGMKHYKTGTDGNYANFDVLVTVGEASTGEVGGKAGGHLLNVVSANIGSKVGSSSEQQNSHRLTFKVYISEK